MNYNEYDDNGNKNGFDLSEIINDRKQRSRFLLFIYLIVFIVLVVLIRVNLKNTNQDVYEEKNNVEDNNLTPVTEEENKELDDMFSFLELNNYIFVYEINLDDSTTIIEGKRFNNKYSFTVNNLGSILYFSGTNNFIKTSDSIDGEYKTTDFPYVLINYFDNNVLKTLISSSTIKDDKYEISNKQIGNLINKNINNEDKINTIELVKSNNKITQIHLNLSNAISSYLDKNLEAKFILKYGNFGLVDDFETE